MPFQRKYGVALVAATGLELSVPMITAGTNDYDGGTWVPATGDVKVRKDGGTRANIATLPVFNNGMWDYVLSASELQAKKVEIIIIDAVPKAVEDNLLIIETFGNASAMYATDYLVALGTAAAQATAATNMARALGLLGDNQVLDDCTYNSNGDLTAANVYVYDTKANATTHDKATGLVYKYSIANTYTGTNLTLGKELRET